jgi:hypothetical protein
MILSRMVATIFRHLRYGKDLELHHNRAREEYGTKWGLDPSERAAALAACPRYSAFSLCRSCAFRVPGPHAYNAQFAPGYPTDTSSLPYAALLRRFPFPPSWPRVRGPLHHLKSYSLSEHARWSLVIPVLLRCWLRESHLRCPLVTVFQSNGSPNDPDFQMFCCSSYGQLCANE